MSVEKIFSENFFFNFSYFCKIRVRSFPTSYWAPSNSYSDNLVLSAENNRIFWKSYFFSIFQQKNRFGNSLLEVYSTPIVAYSVAIDPVIKSARQIFEKVLKKYPFFFEKISFFWWKFWLFQKCLRLHRRDFFFRSHEKIFFLHFCNLRN